MKPHVAWNDALGAVCAQHLQEDIERMALEWVSEMDKEDILAVTESLDKLCNLLHQQIH